MPLFSVTKERAGLLPKAEFSTEKTLHMLVERNLGPIFNCRLVEREYIGCRTGWLEAGYEQPPAQQLG